MAEAQAQTSRGRLLDDPDFCELLKLFQRESVTWDAFLELSMPRDTSPSHTWDVLARIGKRSAVELPIPDIEGRTFWYRRTFRLTDAANKLAGACRSDSHLYRTVTASAGQRFLVRMRLAEVVGACELDGIDVDRQTAVALFRRTKAPESDAERLVRQLDQGGRADGVAGRGTLLAGAASGTPRTPSRWCGRNEDPAHVSATGAITAPLRRRGTRGNRRAATRKHRGLRRARDRGDVGSSGAARASARRCDACLPPSRDLSAARWDASPHCSMPSSTACPCSGFCLSQKPSSTGSGVASDRHWSPVTVRPSWTPRSAAPAT